MAPAAVPARTVGWGSERYGIRRALRAAQSVDRLVLSVFDPQTEVVEEVAWKPVVTLADTEPMNSATGAQTYRSLSG